MDYINIIQQTFPGLPHDHAEYILEHARENTYPAGTLLCKEGAIETTFYVILEGRVEITKWLEFAEQERHIRYSDPGDFFGEMGIILDAPRGANVRTTKSTTVIEIDRDTFLEILGANPQIALGIMRTTLDRLRSNDQLQIKELSKNYDELQVLNQAKTDFIEVAAHELRTPLTVIQGYGKVLATRYSNQDATTAEIVTGLEDGVGRMLHIVNAMIDISRIENGTLTLSRTEILPKFIVDGAINDFQASLKERNVTISEVHEPRKEITTIHADPDLLNKVFYQLISNAIKYTPDGGRIEVITREVSDQTLGLCLEIIVKDGGIGVEKDNVERIFEKFYQGGDVKLHTSSKTAFLGGGPGLGLAIAQGIINAHGGTIKVVSEGLDRETLPGTTFHVLLPAGKPAPTQSNMDN